MVIPAHLLAREDSHVYEDVHFLFNTSLAEIDRFGFDDQLVSEGLPDESWRTRIGPIDHHLGKHSLASNALLLVGPRWERVMREAGGDDGLSPWEAFTYGVDVLGFGWRLADVVWYHRNHADAHGWFSEDELNAELALEAAP